jgi:hypothetical protein
MFLHPPVVAADTKPWLNIFAKDIDKDPGYFAIHFYASQSTVTVKALGATPSGIQSPVEKILTVNKTRFRLLRIHDLLLLLLHCHSKRTGSQLWHAHSASVL